MNEYTSLHGNLTEWDRFVSGKGQEGGRVDVAKGSTKRQSYFHVTTAALHINTAFWDLACKLVISKWVQNILLLDIVGMNDIVETCIGYTYTQTITWLW